MIFGIILAIGMFIFLVIIHELGHFTAAKKTGVKVLEFGLGIPPKQGTLWTDKSGTEYTLNRVPLGGFVRLKGENPDDSEDFNAPDSFVKASLLNKLIILVAGVAVNTLFAWLAFSFSFMSGVYPINVIPETMIVGESRSYLMPTVGFLEEKGLVEVDADASAAIISTVIDSTLAQDMALEPGDTIVSVNGEAISTDSLSTVLKDNIGNALTIVIERDGEQQTVQGSCEEDSCFLGVKLEGGNRNYTGPIKFGPVQSFVQGYYEVVGQTQLTFKILGTLGRNLISFNRHRISTSVNRLSGPVGIVKFGEGIFSTGGWVPFLAFGGMISLALAIFNILPIPALDGGRMLGAIIQEFTKIKAEKYFVIENYFNMFFFTVLMILGVYIILLDLVRHWDVPIPFIG